MLDDQVDGGQPFADAPVLNAVGMDRKVLFEIAAEID